MDTKILKDPEHASSRIFIGNLPICTKEELESICIPYGKPIASMVKDKFGFVQFENEQIANKAASSLTGSSFKSKRITVRNAASKPPTRSNLVKKPLKDQAQQQQPTQIEDQYFMQQEQYHANMDANYNDCEIIVLNKDKLTKYAEFIESRLKRLYLRVDLLFPNPEVPIGKVLANISSRGCLYAILVTEQNEEHQSITVNILYDQPAEHRNMPVEDAINLIATDFRTKLNKEIQHIKIPLSVPIIPQINKLGLSLKERHPEAIQMLLNLLADNMPLTVLQYDRIIQYLKERRDLQMKAELGESYDNNNSNNNTTNNQNQRNTEPDPEIELQKKILNILNKPSISDKHSDLMYPTIHALLKHNDTIDLLKDIKIQQALDSLMVTSLVGTIGNQFKF